MKRNVEDVKTRILNSLWLKPFTIQQISKEIDSNWITVGKFVEELKQDGKLKEVISTDKLTLYQKVNEDVYYNLPLTPKDREMFRFIFSTILKKFKEKEKIPNKTELAKAVVDVVSEAKLNLPIVWYIYGQIPLMVSDPQKDYFTSSVPKNHLQIEKIADKVISDQEHKSTKELKIEHYEKYKNELYQIKEKLLRELKNKNKKEVLKLFNEFYIACPINQNAEMFFLTDRLCIVVRKLNHLNLLEENIINVALALDSLWKYIALHQMINSLLEDRRYNKKDLMQFYLNPVVETKKYIAKEYLSNIESIYLENLSKFDPKSVDLSKETQQMREIMEDWTGED